MVFPNALLAFPTRGLAGIALPTVCGAMQQLFNRNLGTGPYRGAKIVGVGMANKCKRYRFDSSIMKSVQGALAPSSIRCMQLIRLLLLNWRLYVGIISLWPTRTLLICQSS